MAKKKKGSKSQVASLFETITTLHGTHYFSFLKGRYLTIWMAAMVCIAILTISFILVIKDKFNANQIVTEINANCKVNQVPFPAVSICNFNVVSLKESKNIAKVLKRYNISDNEIQNFFNALPFLTKYSVGSLHLNSFTKILGILKHHYFTIDTIMEEVHQKCENLLVHCSFNRKQKSCADMFSLIKTLQGYCCTFNYAALNDASEVPLLPPDEELEYYNDQDAESATPRGIIATTEAGKFSGLSVVLNVEPEDYPSWSLTPSYGAQVLLSDPNDYPETTILYRYIAPGEAVDIKVEPMVFQSAEDVRRVEPEKRTCWFHDEVILGHTDRYSHETCNTECRMRNYLEICGCIPYKYPREKSIKICEFEDLKCLNNVTAEKSMKQMLCDPVCYMECRDKKYTITSDVVPFLPENEPWNISIVDNTSSLSALQVYFGKSNCNCYKLDLLIDINNFIATYGGVFSLSFGVSIITLFELVYLLVLFLVKVLRAIPAALYKNKNIKKHYVRRFHFTSTCLLEK